MFEVPGNEVSHSAVVLLLVVLKMVPLVILTKWRQLVGSVVRLPYGCDYPEEAQEARAAPRNKGCLSGLEG
jgi:hypothetical protein